MKSLLSNSQRGNSPEQLWRQLDWWLTGAMCRHFRLTFYPSLPSDSRLLYQFCATGTPIEGRAFESIRQLPLRRLWFKAASAFGRWMLPTVERGPPGHAAFERRL